MFDEVVKLTLTPEQEKAVAIANAGANNALSDGADPLTDGAYFAARVQDVLTSYVQQYITAEQTRRLLEAVQAADDTTKTTVAATLGVDLVIAVPVGKVTVAPSGAGVKVG